MKHNLVTPLTKRSVKIVAISLHNFATRLFLFCYMENQLFNPWDRLTFSQPGNYHVTAHSATVTQMKMFLNCKAMSR